MSFIVSPKAFLPKPLGNIERQPARTVIFRNNDTSSLGSSRQGREGLTLGTVWDTLIRNCEKVVIIRRAAEKDTAAATRDSQMPGELFGKVRSHVVLTCTGKVNQ